MEAVLIRRGGRQGFQSLTTSMLGTFELCMDAWKSNGHMAQDSCIRYMQHAARWKNGRWSSLQGSWVDSVNMGSLADLMEIYYLV